MSKLPPQSILKHYWLLYVKRNTFWHIFMCKYRYMYYIILTFTKGIRSLENRGKRKTLKGWFAHILQRGIEDVVDEDW